MSTRPSPRLLGIAVLVLTALPVAACAADSESDSERAVTDDFAALVDDLDGSGPSSMLPGSDQPRDIFGNPVDSDAPSAVQTNVPTVNSYGSPDGGGVVEDRPVRQEFADCVAAFIQDRQQAGELNPADLQLFIQGVALEGNSVTEAVEEYTSTGVCGDPYDA